MAAEHDVKLLNECLKIWNQADLQLYRMRVLILLHTIFKDTVY